MATRQRANTVVAEQLQEALDAAECPEVRYHIRESMQLLHLDDEEN
ncbi:hypothetical protein [Halolamina salina]|uniref:Uncharacterized protein n=1 Tax=Halolamina salina TaxID=1220023 RepID=A0ABD6B543_9EURY